MRHRISGKKDAQQVVHWVKACAILHNMILEMDQWDERDTEDVTGAPQLITEVILENIDTAIHRELIKEQVLQYNHL